MGTMNNKEAYLLLGQLMAAKELVKKLEADYRKICSCNNKTAVEKTQHHLEYSYGGNTCSYHTPRYYHKSMTITQTTTTYKKAGEYASL
jgi:hypothetical protein